VSKILICLLSLIALLTELGLFCGSHNLAEDVNLENEKLDLVAGQCRWRLGSPSCLSSRIDPDMPILRVVSVLSWARSVQSRPFSGYIA